MLMLIISVIVSHIMSSQGETARKCMGGRGAIGSNPYYCIGNNPYCMIQYDEEDGAFPVAG